MTTKLMKARTLLILDHPFFGALALRMKLIPDPAVKTANTNGIGIRYNPEWIEGLTMPELVGVLAHEVMHVAAGHIWRRGNRSMPRWNIAADYAINSILLEAGLRLPRQALRAAALAGKAAEEIYAHLPEQADGEPEGRQGAERGDQATGNTEAGSEAADASSTQGRPGQGQPGAEPGQDNDPGACGGVVDAPAGSTELEQEWRVAITQAAQVARTAGNMPGSLDRLVTALVNPVVPWRVLLRDFVERSARNDYDWRRPNARHLQRGFVLPGLVSEELSEIVVVVDTSGSIGQAELDRFAAEVSAVLGEYETTIHVVYADTRVCKVEQFSRCDLPITFHPVGGGGTNFGPAVEWAGAQGFTPACLIYLTDLYGRFPDHEPEFPVLWVVIGDNKTPPPFGNVAVMDAY